MFIKIYVLCVILIFPVFISGGSKILNSFSSERSAMTDNFNATSDNYILKVNSVEKMSVFNLILYNKTKKTIYFLKSNSFDDVEIEIKDRGGNIVKSKEDSNKNADASRVREGSWKILKILPDENATFQVDIKKKFQLASGTYRVVIKKTVILEDGKTSQVIQSIPTEIKF